MTIQNLLIVDDEVSIREPLADYLANAGFHMVQACDAVQARELMMHGEFDLIVLDITMPGEDGLSLCRFIREKYQTPVILLTAHAEDTDRIIGLEIGADDYVSKPFNPRELMARIRAVLRRTEMAVAKNASNPGTLVFGGWVLRIDERVLLDTNGVGKSLTTGEYNLLVEFLRNPRTVLSRDSLLELSRGRSADAFDRSVDNMVSRLRNKIERDPKNPEIIKTVWGSGYMFTADVHEA